MFSGVSALLLRALREDALLMRFHLLRGGGVLFMIVIAANSYLQSSASAVPGRDLFSGLLMANILLVSLAGAGYFASAIAEEKEEETLGLLLMAGVSPLGILLGKSTSRLVLTLMLGLLELPFLMLAVTLGGVTNHQILCGFFMIAGYTVLVANLGLLCSVVAASTSQASRWMVGLLLGYSIGPPLFSSMMPGPMLQPIIAIAKTIRESSPWSQIGAISQTGYAAHPISFQVASNFIVGVLVFFATWMLFNRSTRDLGRSVTPQRGIPILSRLMRRGDFPSRRCIGNPFIWKDFYFLAGGFRWIVINSILLGVGVCLFTIYYMYSTLRTNPLDEEYYVLQLLILHCMATLHLASLAGRMFSTERRDQTLQLLFLTPNSRVWIIYSKLLGTFSGAIPSLVAIVAAWRAFLPFTGGTWSNEDYSIIGIVTLYILIYLHFVVLLSLFLKWGAVPAAVGVMFCGSFCWGVFLTPNGLPVHSWHILLIAEMVIAVMVLHVGILARLRWLIQS